MFKLFIKIIVFFGLFILGLVFSGDLFKEKKINYFSRNTYKNLHENASIAIFGSSHGLNALDTRFLEKELHKSVYNFSAEGQRIVSTIPVVSEIINDNKIELAIVEIFNGTTRNIRQKDTKTKRFQYNTLDNISLSFEKIKAHTKINGISNFFNLFPTIRRHSKWTNVFSEKQFFVHEKSDFYKGFFTGISFNIKAWDKKIAAIKKNKGRNYIVKELLPEEKANINRLIKLFEQQNIPLLFVTAPFNVEQLGMQSVSHNQLLANYMLELGVPYINYNNLWETLKLQREDFLNLGHLNSQGAIKVSRHLANFVKENYSFNNILLSQKDLSQNRYEIIKKGHAPILTKSFDSIFLRKFGVEEIFVFSPYTARYEILIKGQPSKLKNVKIRYEYEFEAEKISEEQKRHLNKNSIVTQTAKLNNRITYINRDYYIFQFNSDFKEIQNFKLFLIKEDEKIELVNFAKLKLKK